ncbi:lysophospholipid acyltransferase family protein [Mucisphaera calidilacus]|uniref:Acyltransferase n=1 Tax=Mucisphaera calidilacus TaxID=2527982 RepID=A0A518BUY8_9BACT|nr:lysophospholipid acyltransferase family protein [Mucisphaera calidilacus]QDU70803.1 Acyltransferase [Mucisphaera calidilacus]
MSKPASDTWSPSQRSAWWYQKFAATTCHLVAGTFGRVRTLNAPPPIADDKPLIIASNHPSWWDPMVGLVALLRYFPDRPAFVPIDPEGMNQHPIFPRVGFFPVAPNTARGARSLLRHGRAALETPGGLIWITPEGRFVDPGQRPLHLKPGTAALATRVPNATLLPATLDYRFGPNPRPDARILFGQPIEANNREPADVHEQLADNLTASLDRLAATPDDDPAWTTIFAPPDSITRRYYRLIKAYLSDPRAYDLMHLNGDAAHD